MPRSTTIASVVHKGFKVFLFFALFFSMAGLLMIQELGRETRTLGREIAPMIDAIMELKFELAQAEALTERVIASDSKVTTPAILFHLDRAEMFGTALLAGAETDEGTFVATDSPKVRDNVTQTLVALASLRDVTQARLEQATQDEGVGTGADERFDAMYDALTDALADVAKDNRIRRSAPSQTLIGEARYRLAHGHLLVAEILGGDFGEDFEEVTLSFQIAREALGQLIIAPSQTDLIDTLARIDADIAALSTLAVERHERTLKRIAKEEALALQYANARNVALTKADDAETIIKSVIARSLSWMERAGLVFIAVFVLVSATMVAVTVFAYRGLRQRVILKLTCLNAAMTAVTSGAATAEIPQWSDVDELSELRDTVVAFRDVLVAQARLEEEARAASDETSRALAKAKTVEREARQLADDRARSNRQLQDVGRTITTRAESFVAVAASLAQQQVKQRDLLASVQTSISKIDAAVTDNTRASREARDVSIRVRDGILQSGQVMQDMVGTVDQLAEGGQEISGYIGIIEEISRQTNLLSLNASVEASRAGDAGAGFSIVASEVRNLSKRTAEAADSIRGLVEKMSRFTQDGKSAASRAEMQLNQIEGAMKDLETGVANVEAASRQQTEAITETSAAYSAFESTFTAAEDLSRAFLTSGQDMLNEAARLNTSDTGQTIPNDAATVAA